jgi:hypothetical protein
VSICASLREPNKSKLFFQRSHIVCTLESYSVSKFLSFFSFVVDYTLAIGLLGKIFIIAAVYSVDCALKSAE